MQLHYWYNVCLMEEPDPSDPSQVSTTPGRDLVLPAAFSYVLRAEIPAGVRGAYPMALLGSNRAIVPSPRLWTRLTKDQARFIFHERVGRAATEEEIP